MGAPELSRRPPAAINSRIYIIVSEKKLSICKRGSKTQAKARVIYGDIETWQK